MVRRARAALARSPVAYRFAQGPQSLTLDGAVGQLRRSGHAFGKFVNCRGNVYHHPVQMVRRPSLVDSIRIMHDQNETRRTCRDVGPFQPRRNRVRACPGELWGDLRAIHERGRAQREPRHGRCLGLLALVLRHRRAHSGRQQNDADGESSRGSHRSFASSKPR